MMIKKVLSVRKYKAGYEVREELFDGSEFDGADFVSKSAYNPSGDYIGNSKTAYRLCKTRGIAPVKVNDESNVCSIGWCEKEQKWYGWSHRALFGFGIGSEVKRGDCAYVPCDKFDQGEAAARFWDDENHEYTRVQHNVHNEAKELGLKVFYKYNNKVKNRKLRGKIYTQWEPYLETFGPGEWKAGTIQDAKQMAIDFAEGVG